MYNEDPTKTKADKWQHYADMLQYGSLGGLFAMIFILEIVSKDLAKILVWPLAGGLFIFATIAFFVGHKAHKCRMADFDARLNRAKKILPK